MSTHSFSPFIFGKDRYQKQKLKKRKHLQQMMGKWGVQKQKREIRPCLSPWTKTSSKWNKDLNMKPETLKLLGKKLNKTKINKQEPYTDSYRYITLQNMGLGRAFLNRNFQQLTS